MRDHYPEIFGPLDAYGAEYPRQAPTTVAPPTQGPTNPAGSLQLTPTDLLNGQSGATLRARSVVGVARSTGLEHPVQVGLLRSLADTYSTLDAHQGAHPVSALSWEIGKWQSAVDRKIVPAGQVDLWKKFQADPKGIDGLQLATLQGQMMQFASDTSFVNDPHLAVHPVMTLQKVGSTLAFEHRNFHSAPAVEAVADSGLRAERLQRLDYRALSGIIGDNVHKIISIATPEERAAASGWYQQVRRLFHDDPQKLLSELDGKHPLDESPIPGLPVAEAKQVAAWRAANPDVSGDTLSAVTAALSGRLDWAQNPRAATKAIDRHTAGKPPENTPEHAKADRLLNGEDFLDVMFAGDPRLPALKSGKSSLMLAQPEAWFPVPVESDTHAAAVGFASAGTTRHRSAVADAYRAAGTDAGLLPGEAHALVRSVWKRLEASATPHPGKVMVFDDRVLRLIQGEGDLSPAQMAAGLPAGDVMVPTAPLGKRPALSPAPQTLHVLADPASGAKSLIGPAKQANVVALGAAYPTPYRDARLGDSTNPQSWAHLWHRRFPAPVDDMAAEVARIHANDPAATDDNPNDKPGVRVGTPVTSVHVDPYEALPVSQSRHAILVNALTDLSQGADQGIQGPGAAVHRELLRQLDDLHVKVAESKILNPHQAVTPFGSTSRHGMALYFDSSAELRKAWDVLSHYDHKYNEPVLDRRAYVFGHRAAPANSEPVFEHAYQAPDGTTLSHLNTSGSIANPHTSQTWVASDFADTFRRSKLARDHGRFNVAAGQDDQSAIYEGALRVVDPEQGTPVHLKSTGVLDATRDGKRVSSFSIWIPPTPDIPVLAFAEPAAIATRNPAATPDRILTGTVHDGRVEIKNPTVPGPTGEETFNLSMFERARQALERTGARVPIVPL